MIRRRLKRSLAGLLARGLRRPPLDPAGLRALRPARVLIVRQHNQMGDMVCATPAFRALRRTWPEAELGLVCAPVNWEVVRGNPDLGRIFLFDRHDWSRPGRLWSFARHLRGWRPDLAVVLNSVSFSVTSALIALGSGARWVVGGDSRPFGSTISDAYSLRLPSRPEVDRPAVEHSLLPLAAVGIEPVDRSTVVVPSARERELAGRLRGAGPAPWVLHPGAGKRDNLWPAAGFAAVAARAAAAGRRVLVLQGPADGAVLSAFAAALPAGAAAGSGAGIEILPVLPVGACAALLETADRFLCNDTGLMHVAGAVGTPTLALFGPTDPALWKPPAAAVVALRAEGGDLGRLAADAVWKAWDRLPGRRPAGGGRGAAGRPAPPCG